MYGVGLLSKITLFVIVVILQKCHYWDNMNFFFLKFDYLINHNSFLKKYYHYKSYDFENIADISNLKKNVEKLKK